MHIHNLICMYVWVMVMVIVLVVKQTKCIMINFHYRLINCRVIFQHKSSNIFFKKMFCFSFHMVGRTDGWMDGWMTE